MRLSILALVSAASATAATFAGVATAQPAAPPPPMAQAPKGGDPLGAATVTRAEAQARAAALFERFDTNHDGKLDQADRAARTTAMFDRIDGNHDGTISREEFAAAHQGMGGPGRGGRRGPAQMDHSGMDHGGMDHGDMPPAGAAGTARPPLTREAFMAEAMKRFDAEDTNHDGKLTRDERRAGFRARMTALRSHRGMGGMRGMDTPPPPPPAPEPGK